VRKIKAVTKMPAKWEVTTAEILHLAGR